MTKKLNLITLFTISLFIGCGLIKNTKNGSIVLNHSIPNQILNYENPNKLEISEKNILHKKIENALYKNDEKQNTKNVCSSNKDAKINYHQNKNQIIEIQNQYLNYMKYYSDFEGKFKNYAIKFSERSSWFFSERNYNEIKCIDCKHIYYIKKDKFVEYCNKTNELRKISFLPKTSEYICHRCSFTQVSFQLLEQLHLYPKEDIKVDDQLKNTFFKKIFINHKHYKILQRINTTIPLNNNSKTSDQLRNAITLIKCIECGRKIKEMHLDYIQNGLFKLDEYKGNNVKTLGFLNSKEKRFVNKERCKFCYDTNLYNIFFK